MSKNGTISIETDLMRNFVRSKNNDMWIWHASERSTNLIAGIYAGKKMMPKLLPYEAHFLKTAEYFLQTAWPLAGKSFLQKDIWLSVNAAGKQVISNCLI